MTITFAPATKEAAKARIALSGPSGAGKTYTELMLAHALSEKVAVIDTEPREVEEDAKYSSPSMPVSCCSRICVTEFSIVCAFAPG